MVLLVKEGKRKKGVGSVFLVEKEKDKALWSKSGSSQKKKKKKTASSWGVQGKKEDGPFW